MDPLDVVSNSASNEIILLYNLHLHYRLIVLNYTHVVHVHVIDKVVFNTLAG